MNRSILHLLIASLPLCSFAAPISFREEIAPVLLEHCQACHGPSEQRGGYRVDTIDFLSRNEDPNSPVLSPNHPEKSSIFQLLISTESDERMPKKAPQLPSSLTEKVRRWIAEGAHFDTDDRQSPLVELVPPKRYPAAPEIYTAPFPVTALAFTPDGKRLLVSGLREILLRDSSSGKLLQRITNVPARTFDILIHPDGSSFLTAGGSPGESGEIRQYDLASGKFIRQLAASTDAFLDVEISPDGNSLIAAGADHSLSIIDMRTGRKSHRLNAHADAVTGLAMSPDGKRFASVGLDRIAKVHDVSTGKLVNTYREHQAALFAVGFLPGDELITAGRDKSVHGWKAADVKKTREIAGIGDVFKSVLGADSIYLGGASGKVSEASSEKLSLKRSYEGLQDWINSLAAHPLSHSLAAGSHDGKVMVWSTDDGTARFSIHAQPVSQTAETNAAKLR
jgi:WD40 repeat protein